MHHFPSITFPAKGRQWTCTAQRYDIQRSRKRYSASNSSNATSVRPQEQQQLQQHGQVWLWQDRHRVFYQQYGAGPVPVVLIHGMGACHDHWKKFIAELGPQYTAYTFDLLGFGDSDKPAHPPHKHLYDYDTWSQQTQDFINQVVQAPAVLVGNSAGALTALQVAVAAPNVCRGLLLLNCTMRRNHERNQHPLLHPLITGWQWLLQETPVGAALVSWVLDQPNRLESILRSAYGDASCLSPELLASFRRHLSSPGSCAVLLDVFSNSTGPLPQDLLPFVTMPMLVVWGAADPWEPVAKAEELFSGWAAEFLAVPGVGHFPMDEVPALIASMLDAFVDECALEESAAAVASSAGGCRPGAPGRINGFTLEGIMAAAELDAKV